MSSRLLILITVITGFAILTTVALLKVGYFGILTPLFHSWGGAQVFADFVILAVLSCTWMRNDARSRGVAVWPFILITLVAGSFGPLFYLLIRHLTINKRLYKL